MEKMEYASSTYMGGLGNRMFQFAVSYAYSKKHSKECVIATNYYQENLQGKLHSDEYLSTIFSKVKKIDCFQPNYRINEPGYKNISYFDLPAYPGNVLLFGYFQCEKYFREYKEEIKSILVFPEIKETPKENSIFLHVRRGDYTKVKIHGGYNYRLYYKNALEYMKNKYTVHHVYVFSDDIQFCKEWELFQEYPEFEFSFPDLNEIETLKFMSLCDKGGIGANSSFSWWGAYLNDFVDKTIIFPNQWFFEHPYDKYVNDIAFDGSVKLVCK
jgi:hypothetical protein